MTDCIQVKRQKKDTTMMMDSSMMWGIGLWSLLALAVLVLVVAALVKYVFFK
jgi:hypothetical protein